MVADLPPAIEERVVCSISAATKYGVPANIILAVAEQEGGKAGQWVRNRNATYDLGSMQFNTAYIRTLARYGIGTGDVLKAGCFSYDLAAWRLRGHIKNDRGDVWTRVANYHSRTPRHNAPYRAKIMAKAARWGTWLTHRYRTYDTLTVARQAVAPVKPAPATPAPRVAARLDAKGPRVASREAARAGYVARSIATSGGDDSYTPRAITALDN